MTVIETIDYLRKSRSMTNYQLSRKAGISQSTLSNLANRNKEVSILVLSKVCDAFEISMSEFFLIRDGVTDNKINELISGFIALSEKKRLFILNLIGFLNE